MRRVYYLLAIFAVLLFPGNVQAAALNGDQNGNTEPEFRFEEWPSGEYYISGLVDESFSGHLNIPESFTDETGTHQIVWIGALAFSECSGITSVTIPTSIETIRDRAFYGCSSLSDFNIPEFVDYVGREAFMNTAWFNNQQDGLVYKDNVLLGRKGQSPTGEIEIPVGTRVVADGALIYAPVTSVNIPNTVTHICNSAFFENRLTTLYIPSSVVSLGYQAFESNRDLSTITVDPSNPVFDSRDNCNAIIEKATNKLILGCQNTVIPSTVTTIGTGAFYSCTNLESIEIPASITSIEEKAFYNCPLTEIRSYATTPPAIGSEEYFPTFIYEGYVDITVYVPAGSEEAYRSANGWSKFQNIVPMEAEKKELEVGDTFTADGITYKVTDADLKEVQVGDGENAAVDKEFDGSVNINSSVTCPSSGENYSVVSIGDAAFKRCSRISSIELPNGILTIGEGAFWGLKVNSLTIPNTVRNIGARAFWGCTELTSLSLPESVNSIGDEAFQSCHELTSINIPRSVESIGVGAFSDCYKVGEIIVDTNNSIYDSRDNSNAIIEKGSNKLIAGCKTTIFPNTVTAIGNAAFYQMFSEGDYIFLEIPNSLTTIGDEAFWNNNGLMSVSIPSSVTNIGSRAFANCAHLEEVYVYHADPLAISDAFENCQYGLQYLYVPFGSLQAYKAAKGWRDFANIIEKLVTEILEPIESETTVDTEKLKNESLTNNVVGGIYYNVGANGYDATDGSIVISEVTSMSKIANSAPFSDDVKNNFCGMIISVAKGKGLFKANVKTSGDAQLVFQIGNDAPTIVKQDERGDVIIPYDVAEDTYFYIYAIHVSSNAVKTRAEQEPLVKIYSITVSPGADMPKFKLTYTVDGKEYKSSELEYGASIKAEEAPTKEGYTFSGWSEIPQTMPAKDVTITGTFTVNKYKLTYTVDGKEYKTSEVEFGASITAEAAPTKEGYTFSGWSEVPKTMPAKDVTVTGTFTANKYKLTYTVDGKEYKTSEVEYGASITAEAAPTKEGYTFSGWSEVPKTMPAKDVTITGTFTVNKYKLTYTVDGKEYKTSEVEYGASITAEAAPIKEGYTFSGWSEVPKTMPAKDVTITGTFTINKYKLTYTVDGKEYKISEVEYGASITAEAAPTKEGYTFSGWSEIPKTMPAKDVTVTGTFTVNKYKLTYTVDGKEYKTSEVEYGASITPEAAPTKEGYTFSGWSEIPKTMPAKDVTITGTFSKGSYKLTYVVDGETYKIVGYDFEASITPEAAPTKEGYTFSGWSDIPKTMPAKDVTVTGTFTINKYKLTYTVDGLEYKTSEVEFGTSITAEAIPTKEGYTFSGWSDIPKTMPAKDVTITGTFTVNKYKLIYIVDGEEYKTYEVEFGSIITAEAEPTKEGYVFSGWSDVPSTMPAEDVTVTGTFIQTAIGEIRADGDSLRIYDLNGNRLGRTKSGVNIIRQTDGKVRKVVVK